MPTVLTSWESFYVIVGSSAAALTGLQFVVIALIADSRRQRSSHEIGAFATPTVIHFCAALYVAAVISAPWQSLRNPSIALGAGGVAGRLYALNVIRRARERLTICEIDDVNRFASFYEANLDGAESYFDLSLLPIF